MAQGKYVYEWPRAAVIVDAVVVAQPSAKQAPAQVLLIERRNEPYKGYWALPGGFVDEHEDLGKAAARELQEETSIDPADVQLTQVGAFNGDDPRGWSIWVAYAALVPSAVALQVKAGDDAAAASWHDVDSLPPLAFNHKTILRAALRHLARQEAAQAAEGLAEHLRLAADLLEDQ